MRSILNYIYSKITSRGGPKIRKWGVQINPIKLFSCSENGPKPKGQMTLNLIDFETNIFSDSEALTFEKS